MSSISKKIQVAVLSLAVLAPANAAFARTHHVRHYYVHHRVYHRKHYSQTGGAIVGAVAGAVIDRHHPLTGALIGAAAGDLVQHERNKHVKH
ncbi:MAG TPA: YMGG-like glycine zipper-containing protein [Thermoanaerobaculia bacterium]|nr:YMGG-like glycine zipper-containing protein [Thermoanaerobaculia bacterium]